MIYYSGYMSPEYAGYGEFSVKSDVFSFGVLVLEIVSGKKNKGFCDPGQCLNLLGHVSMNTGSPLFQCVVVPLATLSVLRCEITRSYKAPCNSSVLAIVVGKLKGSQTH